MAVPLEAIGILSTPLGGLVYHSLILLAVIAGLGIAWGEWRRTRNERARRLLLTMLGLGAVRAFYVVAAFIFSSDWIDRAILMPPLERFADTASIGLLAWAFVPQPKRASHAWDWVFGVNLVLMAGAYPVFTVLWGRDVAGDATLNYNIYWQATVWMVWQVCLILVASLAAIRSQRQGWGMFLPAMFIMFVGAVVQWFYPADALHLPVWQRLANLAAYPLIAVAVYQEVVAGLRVHSRDLQDISQASLDQMKSLLNLFEVGRHTSSSLNLSTVLDNAVRGIARVLDADQCAIVFPEEGDSGTMRLVAIHNPMRQGRGEAVTFPLEYQLTVQQAIRRRKPVIVEESDNVQLKVLFALLGSGETGPLLVQPLLAGGEAMGAIIAGNSRSRRPFSANDSKLCQSMAEQVAAAIRNAQLYQFAQDQIAELNKAQVEGRRALRQAKVQVQELADRLAEGVTDSEQLTAREEAALEARNALEIRLASSRAEADSLSERLAALETDLAQVQANAKARAGWHEEELARLQAAWEKSAGTAESLRTVLQGVTAGILVTDQQGVIQRANAAAEILLDLDARELQGLELGEISADERWRQAVTTASDGEAVRLTMRRGSNTLLCDLAPLPEPEMVPDEGQRVVVVLQDISVEIEEQRMRLDVVASVGVELRTPITTIINYADLLLSETVGALGSAQRKFLRRIKAGAERMARMTDDLAREAGAEERWTRPRHQLVDVNRLIETTVTGSHCQLEDRAITLELDLPDDLPAIKADPDYLRRVMSNLLSNACLASTMGGQIRVRAAQSPAIPQDQDGSTPNGDGFVIVSIRDSGGGLSDAALRRVFDRARPSQTPPGLGESGAGLSLVKTLVEAHGGRLWVESESGVGTTFSFVLPVNEVGKQAGREVSATAQSDESEAGG